jgi:hypothetical protein
VILTFAGVGETLTEATRESENETVPTLLRQLEYFDGRECARPREKPRPLRLARSGAQDYGRRWNRLAKLARCSCTPLGEPKQRGGRPAEVGFKDYDRGILLGVVVATPSGDEQL